ncbi:MAG: hypothetical protein R3Y64_05690 [Peptostreptococcaceae bacterium]
MNVNYIFIAVSMLFVILISIQITLNKIFVLLRDIKEEIEDR